MVDRKLAAPAELPKTLIGWREWVSLPDLTIPFIKAKVDTGAKTSALHAFYLEPFDRNGKPWVRFGVHPLQASLNDVVNCEAPVKDVRRVTDSGGHAEMRPVIETALLVQGEVRLIELTLTDRESMMFRMLLGRNALRRRFVVDSGKSFLLGGNRFRPMLV
ncbi:MAG: ATP-dependent zinc protease [Gammaproteobacteria bacterium]|nr:MAG: ATP-dependent zinc protease [Gammaproteobacteria bacterium]